MSMLVLPEADPAAVVIAVFLRHEHDVTEAMLSPAVLEAPPDLQAL